MPYLIYPERRTVTPEQVIVWAQDDLCNAALKSMANPEDDQEGTRIIAAVMAGAQALTLEEAMAILEDNGSVTFDRRPASPRR